jgi:hypothetical protein
MLREQNFDSTLRITVSFLYGDYTEARAWGLASDRNQWRAICSFKMPSATKETPIFSRQDNWAELRYGTVPS